MNNLEDALRRYFHHLQETSERHLHNNHEAKNNLIAAGLILLSSCYLSDTNAPISEYQQQQQQQN